VAHYVLQTYDRTGRMNRRLEFAAPDDEQAQAIAANLEASADARELWCGKRWVNAWRPLLRRARGKDADAQGRRPRRGRKARSGSGS
jgi:hypothetical protein